MLHFFCATLYKPFNDLLKLARESKQTAVGTEFRKFTTLFYEKVRFKTEGIVALWTWRHVGR